ncbi:MAG: hypothetical protein KAT65_25195, partial [Methanophagales archaeon]|nr:hypothetical protein [Methanophagales archaeon]
VYDTSDTCVVTIVDPGIKVVKTATFYPSCPGACLWGRDPLTVEIGDTVMYCYMVTNMADVTLTDVTVTDDLYGEVTLGKTTLAPGESTWGTLTHVVTESDVPTVTNIATAAGTDPRGRTVTATDDCTINVEIAPDITVDKTASLDGTCLGSDSLLVKIGDTVTYCYVVTNTGDVTLTGVTVTDDLYGEVTLGKITLEPGESTWGTLTHVVTESDFGDPCFPLSLVNTATVTGTDPLGETVTDTDVAKVSLRSW